MAGENHAKTPLGGVKAFNCRNCGGQIELLAPGQSLTAVCKHCGAVADLTDENLNHISLIQRKRNYQPTFEIGATAEFEGHKWKVIGFMVRKVVDYAYFWNEYLLFNPRYGFRFLVENYGHWSLVKIVTDVDLKEVNEPTIRYGGKKYQHFTQGGASIDYALGEFFWEVKKDDVAQTKDLISPPYMLSIEKEGGGIVCSKGEYLEPKEVAAAFGEADKEMPKRESIGANQPNPFSPYLKYLFLLLAIAVPVIIGLNQFFNSRAKEQHVMHWAYNYPNENDTVSPPFELTGPVENVKMVLYISNLFNAWIESYALLHRLDTNISYGFTLPWENYFDEEWSYKGNTAGYIIEGIPSGKYELLMSSDSNIKGTIEMDMYRGIPNDENMLLFILIACILPGFIFLMSRRFERKRNENAD